MQIEVSNGEILDKFTILEIKLQEIKDEAKLANVRNEYNTLQPVVEAIYNSTTQESELTYVDLKIAKNSVDENSVAVFRHTYPYNKLSKCRSRARDYTGCGID